MRSNEEVFIRAVMSGMPVQYRNVTYQLIKAGDHIEAPSGTYIAGWDVLVAQAEMTNGTDRPRTVMLPCQLTLNDMLRMGHNMTEEERIDIISSTVLTSMNKRR